MAEKKKKLFSTDDFDKSISVGDELVFDKPELTKIRIDLTWKGTDLDICAFVLGKDGLIHSKEDLVYFKSQRRWKTEKDFSDDDFNPLKGRVSLWEDACKYYKNEQKWMKATLPLSLDDAVIGSWDDSDNEEGASGECGETMHVLLDEVDTRKYRSIVFAAVVAKDRIEKGETFADAHDPIVSICNAENEEEIAEYKLASTFPGKDAVCFGRMDYDTKTMMWNFIPMGDAYNGGMQYLATEIFN
jgi:stress response protein SCP2